MKTFYKLSAAALTFSLMLPLTGCFGKSKISPEALADYAEEYNAVEYSKITDYTRAVFEGGDYPGSPESVKRDFKKGIVLYGEDKDAKKLFNDSPSLKEINSGFGLDYDSSVTAATAYFYGEETWFIASASISYDSKSDVQDQVDSLIDTYLDNDPYGIYRAFEDGKFTDYSDSEGSLEYYFVKYTDEYATTYVAGYWQGKNLLLVVMCDQTDLRRTGTEELTYFCEDLDIPCPADAF